MKNILQRDYDDLALLDSSLHPVVRRLYSARGLADEKFASLSLSGLLPPSGLLNIEVACDLLEACLKGQEKILVVGDFDADGATSTALSLLCLRAMGFEQVDYLVPNRFEFGYGLTPEIVEVATTYQPDLIMTVDNGIASIDGVALAKQKGIKVLVTDHHLPADSLPDADCILNPNQVGCGFSSKALAGVGVVFYLMMALRAHLRNKKWFDATKRTEPNLASFLDIVALGTVADVVPLDQNNRCLVKHGLRLISSGNGRPGIRALLEVAKRELSVLSASDLGFSAGPRLNAAGRLDDMSLGIECLLCDNEPQAKKLAQQLDDLNKDRRNIEHEMQQQALSVLENLSLKEEREQEAGLCLYDSDWHQGVIGILASRLKEKFHRPAIIFADAGEGHEGMIKGSARSIPGLHIRDLLDYIAKQNPALLEKFGGHAMAAGLSIEREAFPAFVKAFQQALERQLDPELLTQTVMTDGDLDAASLSLHFAQTLKDAGPWGQNFPEPLFEGSFLVEHQRVLGEKHLKLVLALPEGNGSIDAIYFNAAEDLLVQSHQSVRVLYRLAINSFRGRQSPQLMIDEFIASNPSS